MRIKVVRTPTENVIDGIRLDGFRTGSCYEVGTALGAVFLSEGWAVPAESDEPALPVSMAELESEIDALDAVRETYLPSSMSTISAAADRRRPLSPRRKPIKPT